MRRISCVLAIGIAACSSENAVVAGESSTTRSTTDDDGAATQSQSSSNGDDAYGTSSGSETGEVDSGDPETGDADTGDVPVGPAPQWFLDAVEGEWTAIAGEPDRTIRAVLPQPVPHVEGFPDSPGGIMAAWTGGGVDLERGELVLLANGGHADYPGNEGYAIALREEVPAWRRLIDPTPNDQLDVGPATPLGAFNFDGRPRSMHSTFACFGDGRMWFVYQNSYTSGAGDSTSACFSFDRAFEGLPGVGEAPLAWTPDDLGPWTVHPNPGANWTVGFGRAAWDRVGHKVWGVGGNNNINAPQYWSVDTAGAALGSAQVYDKGGSLDNFNSWIAIAHDLRILVAGGSSHEQIFVLSLDDAGSDDDWQAIDNTMGTGLFESGAGAAYVIANHSLAIGNPVSTGNAIYRLEIPTVEVDGDDRYDPSGAWVWSTLEPGGATLTVADGNSFIYSKWNNLEDMGNGQSAIVVATDIDGPVYMYKLPLAGL